MMALLAKACDFHDPGAIELFRNGAKLIGELPESGNGLSIRPEYRLDVEDTLKKRHSINKKMLARMETIDEHVHLILEQTLLDCQLGRMFEIRPEDIDLNYHSISPRFGVKQGTARHSNNLFKHSHGFHILEA